MLYIFVRVQPLASWPGSDMSAASGTPRRALNRYVRTYLINARRRRVFLTIGCRAWGRTSLRRSWEKRTHIYLPVRRCSFRYCVCRATRSFSTITMCWSHIGIHSIKKKPYRRTPRDLSQEHRGPIVMSRSSVESNGEKKSMKNQ